MTLPPVAYNFGPDTPVGEISLRMEKLASAGAKRVMLDSPQLVKCIEDETYKKALQKGLEANGLELTDVHAPHGARDSFGYPDDRQDAFFLENARRSLQGAGELGVKTVTFHCARTRRVGNYALENGDGVREYADLPRAREKILRQLEILMPEVEKVQVILAIENLFLPSSSGEFLASIMQEFSHPLLGLNYDSGHALLLENQPGKRSEDIAQWIRCGWDEDRVIFKDHVLETMLPYVVTAHLHDNHGVNDEHLMPGEGIADWKQLADLLSRAPRLITLQSEVLQKYYGSTPEAQLNSFDKCGF